jgi:hypothetical protein
MAYPLHQYTIPQEESQCVLYCTLLIGLVFDTYLPRVCVVLKVVLML